MKKLISFILCLVIGFAVASFSPVLARSPDAATFADLQKQTVAFEREEIEVFAQTEIPINSQRNQILQTAAQIFGVKFNSDPKTDTEAIARTEIYGSPPFVRFKGFGCDAQARAKI